MHHPTWFKCLPNNKFIDRYSGGNVQQVRVGVSAFARVRIRVAVFLGASIVPLFLFVLKCL